MKGKRKARCLSRKKSGANENDKKQVRQNEDHFQSLSLEVICHILGYLPLRYIMRMDCMNHKLRNAVSMYLRIQKEIDMSERELYGWMCDSITDNTLTAFLKRCHDVEYLYGFHPGFMTLRRQRGVDMLTLPGIIDALSECKNLKGIEISDIALLHAMMDFFPQLEILGTFKNRNGTFPINFLSSLTLAENAKITSLHLNGIVLENLPKMYNLRHLQLRWVHFHESHPFNEFMAPKLQTFVMAHCSGPASAIKYVPLIASLASSRYLSRLELLRVPFLGGLIHHVVQDGWQMNAFRQLRCIRFGACRHALEMDLGFLIITAAQKLEEISVQPSLTKDNLFVALVMADVSFPLFSTLHLGYVDSFPAPDKWDNEDLIVEGLANVSEAPAVITDIGMRAVGVCFPRIKHMDIYNCPHILRPTQWFTQGLTCWDQLTELSMKRCHALKLEDFCDFIPTLPSLQTLHLEQMFREPPKGCSRVGLSAGTGMGLSSAMLNQHYQNVPPANPVVNNNNVHNDGANQNEGNDPLADQNNEMDGAQAHQANQNDERENLIDDQSEEVGVDNSAQEDVAQMDVSSDDKVSEMNEENNSHERQENSEGSLDLDGNNERKLITNDSNGDQKESEEVETVSVGMETVVLYPGKEHKEEEQTYKGLIITETSNMEQETPPELNPVVDLRVTETDLSNVSVTKSEHSDSEVASSVLTDAEKIQEMETDSSGSQETVILRKSGVAVDVETSHEPEYSCTKEIKVEDGVNSPQTSEETNTAESGNTGTSVSVIPETRPTRSCVKHQTTQGRREEHKTSVSSQTSRRGSTGNNTSTSNPNLAEGPSKRALNDKSDTSSSSKVMKIDTSQCSKCSCKRNEKQCLRRRRSRRVGNQGKRGCTGKCKCECHDKDQTVKPSKNGDHTDGGKPVLESSGGCQPQDRETQVADERCKVKEELPGERVEMVDKSCEAKPEDIRQSLLREENSNTMRGKRKKGRRSSPKSKEAPKSNMKDECTSTGDPVVEKDHIQILKINSNSLVSLSLNNVGITSLVLDNCPNLSKLSGHACRVLKEVKLNTVPKIRKVEFTHCAKLIEENLAYEVALQEDTLPNGQAKRYNKAVFLRPMHQIEKELLERLLFSSPDIFSDICVIYDYNDKACSSSYNHMRVFTWGEIFTPMASELINVYGFPEWSTKDWKPQYPWGRDIFRMYERNGNLSRHEMVTDMTLMRILKERPRLPENQIHRFDHARGIYCPNTKGHYSAYTALDSVQDELADRLCAGMTVKRHSCVIYINFSDVNGVPTYDPEFS